MTSLNCIISLFKYYLISIILKILVINETKKFDKFAVTVKGEIR